MANDGPLILIWLTQRLPKLEREQTSCRHLALIKASTAFASALGSVTRVELYVRSLPQAGLIHFSHCVWGKNNLLRVPNGQITCYLPIENWLLEFRGSAVRRFPLERRQKKRGFIPACPSLACFSHRLVSQPPDLRGFLAYRYLSRN